MIKVVKFFVIGSIVLVVGYYILGFASSYIGWYGYKKWKYRVGTSSIEESRKRGVFEKELNFQVDSFAGSLGDFKPYIERGFRYGNHSSKETVPIANSLYPYDRCT